jgi:ABC-type glutathione transport system ATPase component
MEKQDAHREAKTILEKVELWELRSRRAAKLSSGQKQRLSIARALAKPAPILIADEPTGNLDPENSAKVISLLAEAAKDRLVLLITHDFSEAEDYVTRRISLQDGRIIMDAALRPTAEPAEQPAPTPKKKQALSLYAARLQLTGRPVWCSVVLTLLALTAFAVFAFLGTFIVALDDTLLCQIGRVAKHTFTVDNVNKLSILLEQHRGHCAHAMRRCNHDIGRCTT